MFGRTSRWPERLFCKLVAVSAFVISAVCGGTGTYAQTSAQSGGVRGPEFQLLDQHNRPVDDRFLADKPTVVHFGFTHCPVVCPTTMFELSEYMRELGPLADEIRFVFVTVDPERDTPELLRSYLASFDPRLIGLSGSPGQIRALADGLGASYSRQALQSGDVTYDHTVFGYVLGAGWTKQGVLYMGTGAPRERVLKVLKGLGVRAAG